MELSIALPETFKPPIVPDAALPTIFGFVVILCGIMLYSAERLQTLWGTVAVAMSLLLIIVGSPLEGFGVLGPPMALTGGLLAILGQMVLSRSA